MFRSLTRADMSLPLFFEKNTTRYVASQRQDKVWGDEVEIRCLGEAYNKRVCVHRPDEFPRFYDDTDDDSFPMVQFCFFEKSAPLFFSKKPIHACVASARCN